MKKQTRSVDEMFIGALKKVFSGPDKVELGVIPAEEIAVSQDIQERFEGMKVEMETKSRKFMDDLKAEYKPLAKQLDDENRVAWSGIAARFGMTFDELTSRNPPNRQRNRRYLYRCRGIGRRRRVSVCHVPT